MKKLSGSGESSSGLAGGIAFYSLITAFLIFAVLIFYLLDQLYVPRTLSESFDFKIEKGESVQSVIDRLEKNGLIGSKFIAEKFVVFKGIQTKIKPGVYSIGPQYSVEGLFDKFTKGADVEVRILEGWTNWEIARALKGHGVINDALEFYNLSKNFDNSDGGYNFLGPSGKADLEGFLFPDTYRFEKLEARGQEELTGLIDKFLDNFEKKVYRRYENLSGEELNNTVIMASLTEKEVQTDEDMKLVAGILWKRFEAGMPLQVDAALVYIKCNLKNDADCRNLSESDKKLNSSYNTYEFKGLPPAAISNPGLKAISAAINPIESPYWYYLSAKEDGRTIFAKTLEEQNKNRAVYR